MGEYNTAEKGSVAQLFDLSHRSRRALRSKEHNAGQDDTVFSLFVSFVFFVVEVLTPNHEKHERHEKGEADKTIRAQCPLNHAREMGQGKG